MQNLEALLTDEEYKHFHHVEQIEPDWVFELAKLFFWGFGFGVGFMGVLVGVSYL